MWLYLHNSVRTDAMNRPLRLRNVRCGLFTCTNVYPRTPIVIRDCIYIIRVNGRDESDPYAYGMYAADCSRTPTVGADLSCPHITEYTVWIVLVHQHLPTCTHCDTWLHLYNST